MSNTSRFFCYSNGNGFAKYVPLNDSMGELHVMGRTESKWVLAGIESIQWLEVQLAPGGQLWEFSPAGLLGGSTSAAKATSSRLNGRKGGRPRKLSRTDP